LRPTGPAATDASAPILNSLFIRLSSPFVFITTSTRSSAWPPICAPKLPPVSDRNAGAVHVPFSRLRRLMIPLP
jgi:hypothetical protein